MHCEQTETALPLLALDELDAERKAVVEAHLSGCPACRAKLADLRAALDLLNEAAGRLPEAKLPEARRQALATAASQPSQRRSRLLSLARGALKEDAGASPRSRTGLAVRVAAALLICALVAALILPALTAAREHARRPQTLNNLSAGQAGERGFGAFPDRGTLTATARQSLAAVPAAPGMGLLYPQHKDSVKVFGAPSAENKFFVGLPAPTAGPGATVGGLVSAGKTGTAFEMRAHFRDDGRGALPPARDGADLSVSQRLARAPLVEADVNIAGGEGGGAGAPAAPARRGESKPILGLSAPRADKYVSGGRMAVSRQSMAKAKSEAENGRLEQRERVARPTTPAPSDSRMADKIEVKASEPQATPSAQEEKKLDLISVENKNTDYLGEVVKERLTEQGAEKAESKGLEPTVTAGRRTEPAEPTVSSTGEFIALYGGDHAAVGVKSNLPSSTITTVTGDSVYAKAAKELLGKALGDGKAQHEGGQNVLYSDGQVAWKSENYTGNDAKDNVHGSTQQHWLGDADTSLFKDNAQGARIYFAWPVEGIDAHSSAGEGQATQSAAPEEQAAPTAGTEAEQAMPAPVFKAGPVNPWVMTDKDALSTFAVDVDTASYAIARNYIARGSLPPPASVRMEEFVNAFDYNYPSQAQGVFSVHAEAGPAPFRSGLTLLKIGVRARVAGREARKPAHFVFVVDASGSMERPDRMPLVRSALKSLLDQLAPEDRVSLVAFATRPTLVLESTPVSEKARIQAAVDGLRCGGSTNLYDGLKLGYQTAAGAFRPGATNRVILCSDGVANIGGTEADEMLKGVEELRRQGITLTAVGFGYGAYDDSLLERLADRGDGNYVFVGNEIEADRVFSGEMSAALQPVALDAKIQVAFDPARVRRYRLIGFENRDIADADFRNDSVIAGEVGSGQSSTALYELELLPQADEAEKARDLGTVFVRYRNVETGQVEEISSRLASDIVWKRTAQDSPRFFLAASAAEFAEILRGSEHAKDGSFEQVRRVLEPAAAQLPLDAHVQELLELVRRAEGLPRAQ